MSKANDGGLAFPGKRRHQVGTVADYGFEDSNDPVFGDVEHSGMSLRDWFAGQAAIGLVTVMSTADSAAIKNLAIKSGLPPSTTLAQAAAWMAFEYADAMIAAREGGGQ